MYILIYRPHGKLILETEYFGPFKEYMDAEDALGLLPPIGYQFTQREHDHPGCKYIQQLKEFTHDRAEASMS